MVRCLIFLFLWLLSACAADRNHSICEFEELPSGSTYQFENVALYSDGHTNLAFDAVDPSCSPVSFDLSRRQLESDGMENIWRVNSSSGKNVYYAAKVDFIAMIKNLDDSTGKGLLIVEFTSPMSKLNISRHLEELDRRIPANY